ncbi:MAG: hypothetical protein H7833_13490 [Magnetococcus sp. DMHC-1]
MSDSFVSFLQLKPVRQGLIDHVTAGFTGQLFHEIPNLVFDDDINVMGYESTSNMQIKLRKF